GRCPLSARPTTGAMAVCRSVLPSLLSGGFAALGSRRSAPTRRRDTAFTAATGSLSSHQRRLLPHPRASASPRCIDGDSPSHDGGRTWWTAFSQWRTLFEVANANVRVVWPVSPGTHARFGTGGTLSLFSRRIALRVSRRIVATWSNTH